MAQTSRCRVRRVCDDAPPVPGTTGPRAQANPRKRVSEATRCVVEDSTHPTDRPISSAVGLRLSEPASGILGAHGPLVEPLFEQAAKCGIVLQESIDEIVILAERDELEGGCAVDRDNHRLVVTETPVTAQMCFGLTQRNDLHGDR